MTEITLIRNYLQEVHQSLEEVGLQDLTPIVDLLHRAYVENANVYLMGNGGSASTSSHFAAHLQEGIGGEGRGGLRAICLNDNVPRMTAVANDFDYESGTIANRRNFAQAERGYPDGSTVDAEGYLWSCRWEGQCVIRFSPEGKVDQVVEVPVKRVTSCTFGGANLDTLYITTARWDMNKTELQDNPTAGSLFAVNPGVKGLPDARFAG